MTIAILGAGNMGCALATVFAANKIRVQLWTIEADVVRDITEYHRTAKYLPDIALDPRYITATGDLTAACARADGVVLAVPSHVVACVAADVRGMVGKRTPVLSVAKGIDAATFASLPAVAARALGRTRDGVAGLAGPAVAMEFARGTPTAVVVAGRGQGSAFWQRALQRPTFHVERSTDLIGVSWAAALKNVYAIALGMCDGMRYAMNTKALLVERAVAETARVLRRVHGRAETAYGLAGLGDLVTTGFSVHGRNRKFGEMLCATEDCDIPAVLATMTVEGVAAAAAAHAWASAQRVEFPLLTAVWRVCHRSANPCVTLERYLRKAYA